MEMEVIWRTGATTASEKYLYEEALRMKEKLNVSSSKPISLWEIFELFHFLLTDKFLIGISCNGFFIEQLEDE